MDLPVSSPFYCYQPFFPTFLLLKHYSAVHHCCQVKEVPARNRPLSQKQGDGQGASPSSTSAVCPLSLTQPRPSPSQERGRASRRDFPPAHLPPPHREPCWGGAEGMQPWFGEQRP